ncbi:MAG: hypothetical protein WBG86_06180 [Polyangiales bacterium]
MLGSSPHHSEMANELASFRTEAGANELAQKIADAMTDDIGINVTKSQVMSAALWDGLRRAADKQGVAPKKARKRRK